MMAVDVMMVDDGGGNGGGGVEWLIMGQRSFSGTELAYMYVKMLFF